MNAAWQRMAWRTSAGVCAALCWLTGDAAAAAADQPPGASQAAAATTVSLEFMDVPYAFFHLTLPVSERSTPFEKEPPIKPGNVFRGTLQSGRAKTNQLAFVCDIESGKLHIDLNRNLDLTDDPAGSFTSAYGAGSRYQMFTNVHLPVATPAGIRSTAMDLNLYGFARRSFVNAGLRSLWLGQTILDGREWQVGVFENPFERDAGGARRLLLLRPWEHRARAFQTSDGAAMVFGFSPNLFLNGRAYGLAVADADTGDRTKMGLTFTEQAPALGELRLTGQFIDRLSLESASTLVVLDQPSSPVRVPVGQYAATQVRLHAGDLGAVRNPRVGNTGVTVSEAEAATLAVGGPLTNSVTVNRRGRALVLSYQLVGAGDATYNLTRGGPRQPPEFAVFQGETKIASGTFEFG